FFWALAHQQFSGRLVLSAKSREYWVRFNRGQILDAHSPELSDSLAKLAAKSGLASSSQLSQFLMAKKREPDSDDSGLLMNIAKLSAVQLAKLEVHRIAQSAARTFALPDAQFVCYAEQATPQAGVITVEYVLFQGLRKHYDEARLLAELGALSNRSFRLAADANLATFGFGHESESVLDRLRGQPTTAKTLVQEGRGDRQLLLTILYALWATGMLELEGAEPEPVRISKTIPLDKAAAQAVAEVEAEQAARKVKPTPPRPMKRVDPRELRDSPDAIPEWSRPAPTVPIERPDAARSIAQAATQPEPAELSREQVRQRASKVKVKSARVDPKELAQLVRDKLALLSRGANHYQLLDIQRGASASDMQAAYFKLAKKLHPDRIKGAAVAVDPEEAQKMFARINQAFTTLTDAKKREHYHKIMEAGGELAYRKKQEADEAAARRIIEAEENFLTGEMAIRRGQYKVALEQFEQAMAKNPQEGEHHAYYGWSLWMNAADKDSIYDDVRAILTRALKLSPKCAPAHFFIGQIAKHKKDYPAAVRFFKKTLELDRNHSDAQTELRLMRSRGLG
ncbi:MAG: DnaJ domain-containing protein, partial [Deltaproteobacteria bacterium]|nr:DnaJ domain-containing protein [Deltaproteobacteria bacterium]